MRLRIEYIAAAVCFALCSGCSVTTPVGIDASAQAPAQDERFQAWRKTEEARYKSLKPTLQVTNYAPDGTTVLSTTVVDLNGVLGRPGTAMPSGPVAEAATAIGQAVTSIATTPAAIVGVTGAAVVGALRNGTGTTTVTNTEGVVGDGTLDNGTVMESVEGEAE